MLNNVATPLSPGGAWTLSPLPRAVPGTVPLPVPLLSQVSHTPHLLFQETLDLGADCPFAQWTLAPPSSKTRRLALGSAGATQALHRLLPQPLWAQETPVSPSIACKEAALWTLVSMCWAASGLCLAAHHQHPLL